MHRTEPDIVLNESEIKAAIRDYVAKRRGVQPEQVGVALTARRRRWFGSRADFSAPITIIKPGEVK